MPSGGVLRGAAAAADGSGYPSRPVRIVVPFTPGGGSDVIGRQIGHELSLALKQNFIVEKFCLLASARTPAPVIEKLNREVVRVMREPAMIEKTYAAGNEPYVTTPAETREYMTAQLALYPKVVEIAGARAV